MKIVWQLTLAIVFLSLGFGVLFGASRGQILAALVVLAFCVCLEWRDHE